MKKQPTKLKSIDEVMSFIEKCSLDGSYYFDEIYDSISYLYHPRKDEKEFVKEFNGAVKNLYELMTSK